MKVTLSRSEHGGRREVVVDDVTIKKIKYFGNWVSIIDWSIIVDVSKRSMFVEADNNNRLKVKQETPPIVDRLKSVGSRSVRS